MAKKFTYELTILEHHLDTFGHVNNAQYLALFEEARWDIITKNGYGFKEIQAAQQGPVILEVNVKFLKELHARDKIRIETECVDYSRAIAILEQKIYTPKNEVSAEARFKFALFDLKARRIVKPTPVWKKALGIPLD